METRLRLIAAACALVLVAGVVSAFSVDGSDESVAAVDDGSGSGSDSATTGSDDANDSGDVVSQDSGPESAGTDTSTTTAARTPGPDDGDTPGSDDAGAPPTSTDATTSTPTTRPTSSTVPLGVTATTPGTYTYDVTGCCDESGAEFSGTSQLTVPVPDSSGRQAQLQSGPEGSTTIIYRFTPEGTYLESMSLGTPAGSLEFRAVSPILVVPAGASAGSHADGRLKGTGMAASITVDVEFRLAEVTDAHATAEIDATISGTAAGCNVDGDMHLRIRARRSDQLPLDTVTETDVSIGGCLFSADMSGDAHTTLRR